MDTQYPDCFDIQTFGCPYIEFNLRNWDITVLAFARAQSYQHKILENFRFSDQKILFVIEVA